jgi:hypothetical protein
MMPQELEVNQWRSQSAVTLVGLTSGKAIDELLSDPLVLREVSRELVAHYMGASDGSSDQITGERLKEVDLRYADTMFTRLLELGVPKLHRKRPTEERIAGCCRDSLSPWRDTKGFPLAFGWDPPLISNLDGIWTT